MEIQLNAAIKIEKYIRRFLAQRKVRTVSACVRMSKGEGCV